MLADNKQVYSTVEFDSWANRGGLIRSERVLIEKYLDPDRDTLEAGTSGGRILLELQRRGFRKLSGFDYVPEFIERAKQRDLSGQINYSVMDAAKTEYPDEKFEQIIYLQQIISCIETSERRSHAVRDAFRILKPGGTALFSFLCLESRQSESLYKTIMAWFRVLRTIRGSKRSIQYLPWLKHDGKFNWPAILDKGPYVYWYKAMEAEELLVRAGFQVITVGTDEQAEKESMCESVKSLHGQTMRGHIYFVCKK